MKDKGAHDSETTPWTNAGHRPASARAMGEKVPGEPNIAIIIPSFQWDPELKKQKVSGCREAEENGADGATEVNPSLLSLSSLVQIQAPCVSSVTNVQTPLDAAQRDKLIPIWCSHPFARNASSPYGKLKTAADC